VPQCFTGYALVDGKCKECNAGEGCEACAATSVTECVTCNEDGGYVLDAATKKCTTKCKVSRRTLIYAHWPSGTN
jgi:hypothetical protein